MSNFFVRECTTELQEKIIFIGSTILKGDALHILRSLPGESVQCAVTSPPYWGLRDYNIEGQIGLEPTLPQFINRLVAVFNEVKRILKGDGVLWLNIGDGYTSGNRGWRAPDKKNPARAMNVRPDTPGGLKPKDLLGVPWRVAFALQQDGWYLRSDIIWNKPNAMPESVKDRPTRSHEYIFLLSKSEKYYYDHESIMEMNGRGWRNRRTVWNICTQPFPESHFATFPPELIDPCILTGSRTGDYVLDPFFGSGTVGVVCQKRGRKYIGIELHADYFDMAVRRLSEREKQLDLLEIVKRNLYISDSRHLPCRSIFPSPLPKSDKNTCRKRSVKLPRTWILPNWIKNWLILSQDRSRHPCQSWIEG